jgi:hypothetical protein
MWTRNDTKNWLFQIEHRLNDFDHFLELTKDWCEQNCITNDAAVFMCLCMTLVWVSHHRNEKLTKNEIYEILGFDDHVYDTDLFELSKDLEDLGLEELLSKIIKDLPNY